MRTLNTILTPKAILMLAVAGLILIASAVSALFEIIFFIYLVVMIALILADIGLTQGPGMFEIKRRFDQRMSLLEDNPITLEVRNRSTFYLRMLVRDEIPPNFRTDTDTVKINLPHVSSGEFKYYLHPVQRGEFNLERVHVRVLGPLGFVRVGFIVPLKDTFKVYPNLIALRRYTLLAKKDRLALDGFRALRMKGQGTDFAQLREYLPDDDFRRIDWKSSARRNKLIVREYEVERSQNLFIMLDCGRLSSSHLGGHPRLDTMINAALMLAYVALNGGDRVGLMAFSDDIKVFLSFGRGDRQLNRIIESLRSLEPSLVESDYRRAFLYLALKVRRRSMITMFADIIDSTTSAKLLANVSGLTPKHLPLMILMRDDEIQAMADSLAANEVDLFKKVSARNLLIDRRVALNKLGQRGVLALDIPPDKLSVEAVNGYLKLKASSLL